MVKEASIEGVRPSGFKPNPAIRVMKTATSPIRNVLVITGSSFSFQFLNGRISACRVAGFEGASACWPCASGRPTKNASAIRRPNVVFIPISLKVPVGANVAE